MKKNAPSDLQRSTLDSLNPPDRLPQLLPAADLHAANVDPALALRLRHRRARSLQLLLPLLPNGIHLFDRRVDNTSRDREPERRKVKAVLELQAACERRLESGVRLVGEGVAGEDGVLVGVGVLARLAVESFAERLEDGR